MKQSLTILLLFFCAVLNAQITEYFLDSNFTTNPIWLGDTSNFQINAVKQLQLNAPSTSDTSILHTESSAISSASWRFNVKMDFNPSSANFTRVYLVSTHKNLKQPHKAYFVEIGGSDDEVSLYYVEKNKEEKIIDGADKRVSTNPVDITVLVKRDNAGNWSLESKPVGSSSFVKEGIAFHDSLQYSNFFGLFCKYSSTRSDKFFFDSILVKGSSFKDTTPPVITEGKMVSSSTIRLAFSETLDTLSALAAGNYTASAGIGNPFSVDLSNLNRTVLLKFNNSFPANLPFSLQVENIEDTAGNKINPSTLEFEYVVFDSAKAGDLLISEIMADPQPVIDLPEAEYFELWNESKKNLLMKGYSIADLTSVISMPEFLFEAGTYAIVCKCRDSTDFSKFGQVWCSDKLPSLNNSNDLIVLSDSNSNVIDAIRYNNSWYSDKEKSQGGWSLERKSFHTLCKGSSNWDGSINSSGGSPGKVNSIQMQYADSIPPAIAGFDFSKNSILKLYFSESIDTSSVKFTVLENGGNSINYLMKKVADKTAVFKITDSLRLGIQIVTISGFRDCSGNVMIGSKIKLVVPSTEYKNALLLSEVLFDPISDGSDFVELYNAGGDYFDMRSLLLSSYDIDGDSIKDTRELTEKGLYLPPHSYIAFTEDSADLKFNYPYFGNRILIETDLPSLNNAEGTIVVLDTARNIIDRFDYTDDMHFGTIEDKEGVSLERISFTIPTSDASNWHSAAKDAGYGTPGYVNSQFKKEGIASSNFNITPKIISPDNDGIDDFLSVNYNLDKSGFLARMTVYDTRGNEIVEIANNSPLGSSGTIHWNGTEESGKVADMGIYILVIQTYHEATGDSHRYKLPFVVAQKLPH